MYRRRAQKNGFTLLEVLIALAIFAIIGVSAYRVLNTVILSQRAIQTHQDSLREMQRAMLYLSLDIEQVVNRPIRGPYGDELPALVSGQDGYLLELTRQGLRNPLALPRSNLQRIAYELGTVVDAEPSALRKEPSALNKEPSAIDPQSSTFRNDPSSGLSLLRHYWSVLDRAQDSEPKTQQLISGVEDIAIRFIDQRGEWRSEWPSTAIEEAPEALPVALELTLVTQAHGEIKRVYQLGRVQGAENVSSP